MNPFEMVVAIVAIVMIANVLMARYKALGKKNATGGGDETHTKALEDQVEKLQERIHVLERIAVEKEDTLTRQIEELRDR